MTMGVVASLSLVAWVYLLFGRGRFWLAQPLDTGGRLISPAEGASVAVVIPARNEADVVRQSVTSLLGQNYPRGFRIVLVDDQSTDGTGEAATRAAFETGQPDRLTVIKGMPLPSGWTGKLWALKQGIALAAVTPEARPRYLLLTDADIAYEDGVIARLVSRAEEHGLVLTSLMVKLRCKSVAERALIPAFVFFFQMLYPFAWVNDRKRPTAAAAGGCMLVRTDALERVGGIDAIRGSLIDDCALGRKMKGVGPVWLGLTEQAHSLRPYPHFGDIRRMVARSAYDQLGYSPVLLAGTIVGMAVIYVAPPLLAVFGSGIPQIEAAIAWLLMTLAFFPIVRFYKLPSIWVTALPVVASVYTVFTVDSAIKYWRGEGGLWKGRVQANRVSAQ